MKRNGVQVKVKEAIKPLSLVNKNKTIREIGQTLALPKSTVWSNIKKEECTA